MDTGKNDNSDQKQQIEELESLRAIFLDDFIETPPPKAWKVVWWKIIAYDSSNCLSKIGRY